MRQPHAVNYSNKSAQQGFALFIVLMVMIVVAFFVVSVTQSYNTEQRISTNDADRKFAAALAEAALREGEQRIAGFTGEIEFADDCNGGEADPVKKKKNLGLCRAAGSKEARSGDIIVKQGNSTMEAWERKDAQNKLYIDTASMSLGNKGAVKEPRYIIEYISTQDDGVVIYRVTAKAWGKNANTVVVLQSYVSAG